jgi:hypothetical protein
MKQIWTVAFQLHLPKEAPIQLYIFFFFFNISKLYYAVENHPVEAVLPAELQDRTPVPKRHV